MGNKNLPDPRVIFALALFFSSYGVIIRDVRYMAVLLVSAIICGVFFGIDFRRLVRQIKRLLQVVATVALLQSVFAPSGTILFELFNFPLLTVGGIMKGLTVLFRLILFITSAAMFALYKPRALIQGMAQIKLPYEIAYMVSIGVRFVPQMGEELKDSLTALQLRGIIIKELKLKKRLRLYSYLLLPVVAASLQNARELAMSMEMRAFRAMKERTSYYTLSLKRMDIFMLCAILFMAVLLAAAMVLF